MSTEEICSTELEPQTLEQTNIMMKKSKTERSPPYKEIMEVLNVLKRADQYHADEKGFERHYFYDMIIKLLDKKKKKKIDIH